MQNSVCKVTQHAYLPCQQRASIAKSVLTAFSSVDKPRQDMATSILFILLSTTLLVVSTTANTTQESIDLVVLTATQAKSQLIEALALVPTHAMHMTTSVIQAVKISNSPSSIQMILCGMGKDVVSTTHAVPGTLLHGS